MNKKETKSRKEHWEQIYRTKKDSEVSWYQETPKLSLELIRSLTPGKDAEIIDIGGGNSNLAAKLLELGYRNLTLLDISAHALERTRQKLGEESGRVQWVESDILAYEPAGGKQYDLWHDRAAFHFLTKPGEIKTYAAAAGQLVKPSGSMIVSAFSLTGPEKCSGLYITRYSEASMGDVFAGEFQLVKSIEDVHITPFGTGQNFIYCIFRRNPPG